MADESRIDVDAECVFFGACDSYVDINLLDTRVRVHIFSRTKQSIGGKDKLTVTKPVRKLREEEPS